jgi:hypothetical protein
MPELLMVFQVSGSSPFTVIGLFEDHDDLQRFLDNDLSELAINEFDVKIIIDEIKDRSFTI